MMPLSLGEQNQNYTIVRVTGKDEIRAHLRNLGIVEKETIEIKQMIAGNLIVEVKGVRVAINRDLAKRIMI
ncbi:MAG: ferrous iron transport protein A [Allobaculum sp.]